MKVLEELLIQIRSLRSIILEAALEALAHGTSRTATIRNESSKNLMELTSLQVTLE